MKKQKSLQSIKQDSSNTLRTRVIRSKKLYKRKPKWGDKGHESDIYNKTPFIL